MILLRLTKLYNAYMGTGVDHVRFRQMWEQLGQIEREDLTAILLHDHPTVPDVIEDDHNG